MPDQQQTTRMVREAGTYPTVPLRKNKIAIGIVQTRVRGVDGDNPEPGMKENLKYVLDCIDRAHNSGPCDLLCFHEFPIQGFRHYNREQYLRVAIEVPGPEIEEIGKKAKKYNCYITMGAATKDPDWPGHVMNMQIMVGPTGEVIAKHWKQARASRHASDQRAVHLPASTTCLTGSSKCTAGDAVIPVTQTDIGNISMSAVQYEPEVVSLHGAERRRDHRAHRNRRLPLGRHDDVFVSQRLVHGDHEQLHEQLSRPHEF